MHINLAIIRNQQQQKIKQKTFRQKKIRCIAKQKKTKKNTETTTKSISENRFVVYKKLNFSELICICQAQEAVATAGIEMGGTGGEWR